MRLEGKKAIVTGAGGNLGKVISERLAREGCTVAGLDINAEALEAFTCVVEGAGGKAVPVEADLTNFDAAIAAVDSAVEQMGGIDILLNGAGGGMVKAFGEITEDEWNTIISRNLTSVFNVTRGVVPHMQAQQSGRIISIASIAAIRGGRLIRKATSYAAAKAGVVGLTKALAIELAEEGITVNCICPGAQDTPALQNAPKELVDSILAQTPTRTLGQPEEMAETVVYFAQDLSRYVTGVIFAQDGGHSI